MITGISVVIALAILAACLFRFEVGRISSVFEEIIQ